MKMIAALFGQVIDHVGYKVLWPKLIDSDDIIIIFYNKDNEEICRYSVDLHKCQYLPPVVDPIT